MVKKIGLAILASITAFVSLLIGKITWTTPPWLSYLKQKDAQNPKAFRSFFFGIIALLIIVLGSYYWYQSRPKPPQIVAQITPPKLTANEPDAFPYILDINFGIRNEYGELRAKSVAPLNLVGQDVSKGIEMTPVTPGIWNWNSDSRLVFAPSEEWLAGQTYTIHFNKEFFAKNVKLDKMQYTFTTLPFTAKISEFKFYQDPINPAIRQAVATVEFSYPVDTASVENHINLAWQAFKNGHSFGNNQDFKYTVTYSDNKRTAYIKSEILPLPEAERYLQLTLASGIKALKGPGKTEEARESTVLIPDAGSYFKVTKADASIVRNLQNDRPDQVLTIETTLGVTTPELNKSLHVYLLPSDYPATAAETAKPNYQWHDPGEITPAILALAKPLELQAIPTDREFNTLHSYRFKTTAPTFIYVKIDKGAKGFGNFTLNQDYAAVIKAPDYPQEIAFLHKGALLALGTEEKLSVLVRGLNAVKFDFARVLPTDVNHLITQTSGDFSNPYFIDANFNQDNITEIFSETQQFDATDPGKEQYTALDLKKYLATKTNATSPLGLFLLQAHGWDSERKIPLDVQTNRLVLITDLGLLVKDNNDYTHDVFVQSIMNGVPVKNASVAILGKNGVAILTRLTDDQGHVSFPSLRDFTNEREPTVYIVRHGDDVSFIPYNRADRQLNYSRFDVGGVTNSEQNQAALSAYIFSDRGVYRPGETAHVAMIVKQPFAMPQAAGLPLEATVIDPRGVTLKDEKLTLNESGYLTLDFQTSTTSPTGQYLINLYIVKDNHPSSLIGSSTVNVAEFMPDRMRISTQLSQATTPGWISPTDLRANINLWNLYGAPATSRKVSGKILLTPKSVTFTQFPNYTFIDPLLDPKVPPKVFTDTLKDTHTDGQGHAQFDLKLDRFDKATYQLTVFTEGFEAEGGRSVTTETTALVSPLAYLIGYKADGDLNYIKQDAPRSVNFIAVNPQLKQEALPNLNLILSSLHPVTTLVKKADGTYQYQSVMQTTKLSSNTITIPESGLNYTLPVKDIGDYLVTIEDQAGIELSRFKYSVVGNNQQAIPRNAELTVKLNKSEFAAGEDIEMQITAPYTGAGLITIERDKVYAYQWFKTDSTSSIQKIHIPNDFQGGGYVNIAFVRDINSPEIFMSPLSYSVVPFALAHQNRSINVDLTAPELARPGETFPITYKTDKPSKIIIFAVDEGILQVTKYPTPDPLQFFFQKHALEVNTSQIVDQILPKFMAERELSAVGGDDGEAALNKNLNPFKRKTDAPVVYWSGILDSDATPHQVTYQIPDYFNGALRVMAVAVANDAVGAATKTAEVRGYFVINPNVPTFVAPDDEFEVTASIANNVKDSGNDANVTITLTSTPELEIIDSATQSLVIPEGQERSVRFKVRAKAKLGSAEFIMSAQLGDKTSSMRSTLSVRPPIAYSTTINSGHSTDKSKSLALDRALYVEYRNVEASASPSPLILVAGLQNYLNVYPYGCTEQLVSKAMPLLAMANQPWFIEDKKAADDKIQQTIQMLGQRQMSSGGFNYWPEVGTTAGNDFASIYAMQFLTEAKAQGYNVPSDVFSAGINYLKDFAAQDFDSLEQARLRAYAIYILTRNEIVTTNYLTHLQLALEKNHDKGWRKDITSAYIAATYQMLKSTGDADKLINEYQPQYAANDGIADFYNNNIGNAQYMYLLAHHFPERLQRMDDKLLMSLVAALSTDEVSTVLAGYTSLALSAYGQMNPITNQTPISINEVLSDGKQYTRAVSNSLYPTIKVNKEAQQLIFNNPDKQSYFYQLVQAGFDKNLPKQAVNQGIEVYREYRNADDKTLTTTQLGDDIIVHIKARAIDNQYHDNIALVDLLPGGFEVVRNSVKIENIDYADIREDRTIFFASIGPEAKEIVYHIKATATGKFVVPPMFGTSMYNPLIKSFGVADSITVENAQ